MTDAVIEPGSVLGMLGGGQLGAMFAAAARRCGYQVAVWDPDITAPAHQWADHSFPQTFDDPQTYERFTSLVRVVTYEWENIPIQLCERLEDRRPVRPAARILRFIQDRIEQKAYLRTHGFPVPAFRAVATPDQLAGAVDELGYPCMCKTAMAGYDGKGQWKIVTEDDRRSVTTQLRTAAGERSRWIVEEFVEFERELSLVVVRNVHGDVRCYPLTENLHHDGILRQTIIPARVSPDVAAEAARLAEQFVRLVEGVGVFCLEFFQLKDGALLINEIAPRPHNSGHYTLDACTVSQFEQQARAVAGLPLGEARLLSPAVMVNIIGDEIEQVRTQPGLSRLFDVPGAILHVYGKRVVRAKRKMGHVTFVDPLLEVAMARAETFRSHLAQITAASATPP